MATVFAAGASGAIGRGTGGPAFSGVSPLVTVWNNNNDTRDTGSAWITPVQGSAPFDTTASANNACLWFADRLARHLREPVKLWLVAIGAATIAQFKPPSSPGAMWTELTTIYALASPPPADVFLWLQGGSETGMPGAAATYYAAFETLRAALISEGVLKADAPTILGGINANVDDTFLRDMPASVDGTYFAEDAGLNAADSAHFNGPDLYALGCQRIWNAYQQHTGPRVFSGRLRLE